MCVDVFGMIRLLRSPVFMANKLRIYVVRFKDGNLGKKKKKIVVTE